MFLQVPSPAPSDASSSNLMNMTPNSGSNPVKHPPQAPQIVRPTLESSLGMPAPIAVSKAIPPPQPMMPQQQQQQPQMMYQQQQMYGAPAQYQQQPMIYQQQMQQQPMQYQQQVRKSENVEEKAEK